MEKLLELLERIALAQEDAGEQMRWLRERQAERDACEEEKARLRRLEHANKERHRERITAQLRLWLQDKFADWPCLFCGRPGGKHVFRGTESFGCTLCIGELLASEARDG